jgi:hypothetical protein
MALRETSLALKFQGGIETKMDPKAVPTARLLALENAIFTRAVSLSKRTGYTSLGLAVLGAVPPYSHPRGLGVRGDELVLFTDDTSYSYVEGAAAWDEIGGVTSVTQSDRTLIKTVSAQTLGDYAAVSGIGIAAWEDSRGGVYFAVLEDNEGRVTYAPTQASSTGSRPRCVRCGEKLFVLWAEAALGQVKVIVIDPTQPHTYDTTQYPRVIIDDLVTTAPGYDAAFVGEEHAEARAAAAITWNALGGVRVGWIDPSGVLGSPVTGWTSPATITPAATVTCGPTLAVAPWQHDKVALAWATAANTYVTAVGALASTATPFTPTALGVSGIDAIALAWRYQFTAGDEDAVELWLEDRNATARLSTVTRKRWEYGGAALTDPSPATIRGACLASKAWTDCAELDATVDTNTAAVDHAYVVLVHDVPLFGVYLTLREDGLVIARTLPTIAADAAARPHLPQVFDDGAGGRSWRWAAVFNARLDSVNRDVFTEEGLRLVSLDFGADDSHQSVYVGRTLYLGGACPMAYDGAGWVESAFHYAPDWETSETLHTNSTAGTGGMTAGTRAYAFWYEATLATGEIVRGPVSKPYEVETTGSDDRVTLTVPTLRISAFGRSGGEREHCRVVAARTVDGDASFYYRVTSTDPSTEGSANGYATNSQSADSVTIIDDLSDTALLLREPLYTTGGVLSNDPTPGAGIIAAGKGRVFASDPSDPSAIYYSQELAEGYAVEQAPESRIVVPPAGGRVTGLGVLDDVGIIFKRGAIYGFTGDGPLANPEAGGGWSAVGLITSDVGCIDQRTIVTTPVGLMFQSAKGIYLLDRGRSTSYIGAPVEAYNAQRITRATLVEDTHQVRFLTDDGSTLLYDYQFGQWSTFTNHEGLDAVIVGGDYHYLRTDGRVFKQAATYADANLQIPLVIETAWIHLSQSIQGFQRIWHAQVNGTWKSAHVLRVQYQTDYDGTVSNWSEPRLYDATDMGGGDYGEGNYGAGDYGGDPPTPYQFTFHVGQKCQAVRFRFSFFEAVGVEGACAELTELKITGGAKAALYKLSSSRSK